MKSKNLKKQGKDIQDKDIQDVRIKTGLSKIQEDFVKQSLGKDCAKTIVGGETSFIIDDQLN